MANAVITTREIIYLAPEKVMPNPYQPRRIFDRGSLEELAGSIRDYGVLQPISVRLINGYSYELVAGERRLRACKMAGIEAIPAIVVNISDQDSAILAIIENLQRQNLHFFEEAEGFQQLMTDYRFTQEALAERVGKNQSTIANKLRVLKLSRPVRKCIIDNDLTERHARALLRLETEAQHMDALKKVTKYGFTVRKTEELVEKILNDNITSRPETGFIKHYIRDIRILTNTIKDNLDLVQKSGIDTRFDMVQTEKGYDIHISLTYNCGA
jgi:ParB family chromosome partitioning protein